MEEKFTFDQFLDDVKSNSKRILSGGYLALKGGKNIYYYVGDVNEVNAKASKTSNGQYSIEVNVGLLKECYKYIDKNIRNYYEVASANNNLTEEAFLRLLAGAFSEMIFWHEYSHIVRGHFEYLDSARNQHKNELECRRNIELDADIYGSSFLFARIYGIYLDNQSRYSIETLMQAYSIGIRATFEVLHRDNEFEDILHKESKHPHSLLRAYTAITHALSSPIMLKISEDVANECTEIALRELLAFESTNNCTLVDVDMLRECVESEWQVWYKNKAELDEYMILEVRKCPLWTKLKEFSSRLLS
jgi:hypothetical protein